MVSVLGVEFFEDADEPGGTVSSLFEGKTCGEAGEFGEKAFNTEGVGTFGDEGFPKQIHAKPEERPAARVLAAARKGTGAFRDALLPEGAEFDVEETQAAGSDFVLVRNARGAEHQGQWRELFVLTAVAFAVVAAEKQAEEGQLVRVDRELARDGMAEIAKDGAGIFDTIAYGAKELAASEGLLARRDEIRFRHKRIRRDLGAGRMLLLF